MRTPPADRSGRTAGGRGFLCFLREGAGVGGCFWRGGVLWGEGGVCFFVGDIEDIL